MRKNGILFWGSTSTIVCFNILIFILIALYLGLPNFELAGADWLHSYFVLKLIFVLVLIIDIVLFFLFIHPHFKCRKTYAFFMKQKDYHTRLKVNKYLATEISEYISHMQTELSKQSEVYQNNHAEYLALQTQINPHFLYNTLEAIRGDALEANVESIAKTTEALSVFFRYTISDTKKLVSLEDELEHVNNYFTVQQYRFYNRIQLKTIFPSEKNEVLRIKVPKLILQPIVENAIIHGLEGKKSGGIIQIEIELTDTRLLISVIDNGIGIPEKEVDLINTHINQSITDDYDEAHRKYSGIALRNVSKRIQLIFGMEYGLRLMSDENLGTKVAFTLPKIASNIL